MAQIDIPQSREPIFVEIDPDFKDIIDSFLDFRRKDIRTLQTALESLDADRIRLTGHDMKGVGSAYGIDQVTRFGAALEAAAQNGEWEEIRRQIALYEDYMKRLRIV